MNLSLYSAQYFLQATVFTGSFYCQFQVHPLVLLRRLPDQQRRVQLLVDQFSFAELGARAQAWQDRKNAVKTAVSHYLKHGYSSLKDSVSLLIDRDLDLPVLAEESLAALKKRLSSRVFKTLPGWQLLFTMAFFYACARFFPSKRVWIQPLLQASFNGSFCAHALHIALALDAIVMSVLKHSSDLKKYLEAGIKHLCSLLDSKDSIKRIVYSESTFKDLEEGSLPSLELIKVKGQILHSASLFTWARLTVTLSLLYLFYNQYSLLAFLDLREDRHFSADYLLPLALWTHHSSSLMLQGDEVACSEEQLKCQEIVSIIAQSNVVLMISALYPHLFGYQAFRTLFANLTLYLVV